MVKKQKKITTDQMKKVYDDFGIDIHDVPASLQSNLNRLVKRFITLRDRTDGQAKQRKREEKGWEQIGEVGVDSGHLILTDYPDQTEVQHAHELIGQMMPDLATCQRLNIEHPPFYRQLNYEVGHAGAGVIVSAGIGDGLYPVFAKIGEVEGMGKRVKEVKVRFIPHPYFQDTED